MIKSSVENNYYMEEKSEKPEKTENPQNSKRRSHQVAISIVCLCGLYVGLGGLGQQDYSDKVTSLSMQKPDITDTVAVNVDGIVLPNILEMKKVEAAGQYQRFMRFYPWMKDLPDLIILLLTCCAFSLIGSYIPVMRDIDSKESKIFLANHPTLILSSFLTGLVVMGLSFLLPRVLISEGGKVPPFTLMFFSLFAGIYSTVFYKKLSKYADKMFKAS